MKKPQKRFLLITLAALLLILCAEGKILAQGDDDDGCTAASLKGRWGFLITGYTTQQFPPAPYAAGGVLTLTGVAIRALTLFGTAAPAWLSLALTGMLLLGIGVLLLFQRERWDEVRRRLSAWWLSEPTSNEVSG